MKSQFDLLNCRDVKEFNLSDMLGEGTYGVVHMAKDTRTQQPCAIKKMRVLDAREGFPVTSLRQIKILRSLGQHPNIVSLKDVVVNNKHIYLVFEFCEIDLFKLTSQMFIDKLSFQEGQTKCLILQLMKGINYAHEKFIIHRDLKLSNLLLTKDGILKIADFGLAREYQKPLKPITRTVVTLWYRAPELLLKTKQYGTSVDVWSIGCIIGELLNKGEALFRGTSEINQFHHICELIGYPTKETWPEFFSESKKQLRKQFQKSSVFRQNNIHEFFGRMSASKSCCDLMEKILCWDPNQRITLEQALNHPFFSESPKPCFPDQLKVLSRLDFYSKKSMSEMKRKMMKPKEA